MCVYRKPRVHVSATQSIGRMTPKQAYYKDVRLCPLYIYTRLGLDSRSVDTTVVPLGLGDLKTRARTCQLVTICRREISRGIPHSLSGRYLVGNHHYVCLLSP
jgi:hypothetical protein